MRLEMLAQETVQGMEVLLPSVVDTHVAEIIREEIWEVLVARTMLICTRSQHVLHKATSSYQITATTIAIEKAEHVG